MSVVCCQVEVSATGSSLVQMSPTDCGASLCVIKKARESGGPSPLGGCRAKKKKLNIAYKFSSYFTEKKHKLSSSIGQCCLGKKSLFVVRIIQNRYK